MIFGPCGEGMRLPKPLRHWQKDAGNQGGANDENAEADVLRLTEGR